MSIEPTLFSSSNIAGVIALGLVAALAWTLFRIFGLRKGLNRASRWLVPDQAERARRREDLRRAHMLATLLHQSEVDPVGFRERWVGRTLTFRGLVTDRLRATDGQMLIQVEAPWTGIPCVAICVVKETHSIACRQDAIGRPLIVSARLKIAQPQIPQFLFVQCEMFPEGIDGRMMTC